MWAISSTARSNASAFALDGLVEPLILLAQQGNFTRRAARQVPLVQDGDIAEPGPLEITHDDNTRGIGKARTRLHLRAFPPDWEPV